MRGALRACGDWNYGWLRCDWALQNSPVPAGPSQPRRIPAASASARTTSTSMLGGSRTTKLRAKRPRSHRPTGAGFELATRVAGRPALASGVCAREGARVGRGVAGRRLVMRRLVVFHWLRSRGAWRNHRPLRGNSRCRAGGDLGACAPDETDASRPRQLKPPSPRPARPIEVET
jgi:hypothetical protein